MAAYPSAVALAHPKSSASPSILVWLARLILAVTTVLGGYSRLQASNAPAGSRNAACMACHSDSSLSMRKEGKRISLFIDENHLTKSVHKPLDCVDCHEGFDAEAQPHKQPMTPVDCGSCHENLGKSHVFHPRTGLQTIPAGPDTACLSCHGSHDTQAAKTASAPFSEARQAESCGRCHPQAKAALLSSAHSQWQASGSARPPSCLDCHRQPIVGRMGMPPDSSLKLAQVKLCESCHVAKDEVSNRTVLGRKFVVSFDNSVHGAALQSGKAEAAGCVDCHGSHETNPALVSNSKVNLQRVAATCAKCHEKEASEFHASVHSTALQKGNMDSPSCTRCHGEHDIKARNDPSAPVHAKNLSKQVCASCHASVRLSQRYGLSTDRFATFTDSFHGLAVRGGAVEVVNCASCHGFHAIKSQKDPTSSINKTNLVQTCGHCHPGASTGFSVGNVHASLEEPLKEPVLYWVTNLYVLLILLVVGAMALHNFLDFFKKARIKLAIQKGLIAEVHVEHRLYLRMTAHERVQHASLVLSFTLLVVTGFMLHYPEAWWVTAIQHLSARAFEWRGLIHRIAGVVMLLAGVWHIAYLTLTRPGRSLLRDLLPCWSDLTDPWKVLRYNLGLAKSKPRFGRFCYIEKAEYWALVWGTLIMGLTGAILWFDNTSMGLITKLGFDVARVIHFYEAILATLAIIVWHFYFVIFNPDIYPMNLAWLTGRMSEREMLDEHPAQLDQIKAAEARLAAEKSAPHPDSPVNPPPPDTPDFPA